MEDTVIPSIPTEDSRHTSRRNFLKRAAVAAGTAPFIVTVVASRAGATHEGPCHARQSTCANSLTSPVNQCCASDNFGEMVCCAVGLKAGTCNGGAGASCSNNAQCCNSSCFEGTCEF